ncbi:Bacterial Pleckstrin-like y domain-containing protein [Mycobacterium sp. smrl_JER01]
MAELERNGPDLELRLTLGEKIAGLHGDIRVPLSAVTAIEVVDEPLPAVAGVRAPGLHWPGRTKIGTWRRKGRKTFAVARVGSPAVQIELDGENYDRLVVSVADAQASAAALR